MRRAHLRRYGALDRPLTLGEPKPEARRANPEILASASEPQRVRLAGCLRAPPRIWTLLIALAEFLGRASRVDMTGQTLYLDGVLTL